ncbi:MAG: hypothetical protein IKY00_06705, partial [Clostridia bacterium]|nr:hypothetical protein [Clostridia bacterium]
MKKGKKITAVLLSIMLVVGVCVLWATLTASASLAWENPAQDEGAVNFLTVNCDGTKKHLKIVKTGSVSGESGNLTVYEADTLAEAQQAD